MGTLSSLITLAYTTAGGVVGSIATTTFNQQKERLAARAELRRSLHRIFRAGTMLRDMRAELFNFQERMEELEITALTAGAPRALVDLHQSARHHLYEIWSFSQIVLDDGEIWPRPWEPLERDQAKIALDTEAELKRFAWHPLRTRILLSWKLRKLRRRQELLEVRHAGNWLEFNEHRRRCIEFEIARSNPERRSERSIDPPPASGNE